MSNQGSIRYVLVVFLTFAVVGAQISIEITQKAFSHVFKKELSELRDSMLRHRPDPFKASYLGLELTIEHLQIVHFKSPRVIYETSFSNDRFFIKILGGSSHILGQYSAIYKTKRDGQFELSLEHFDMTLPVESATMSSRAKCSLRVDDAIILMTPALPEQITKMIRNNIMENIEKTACEYATNFVREAARKMRDAFELTDITQGNRPSKYDFRVVPSNFIDTHPHAFHIEVTDTVINSELTKLYSSADTRFYWNEVPEIRNLLADCAQPECRTIEDGLIVSTISDNPFIRIQDNIVLNLPLTTVFIMGSNKEMFRIRSDLILEIRDLIIYPPTQSGTIEWDTDYKVKEIRILQTSSSRIFQKLITRIDEWINSNTEFIETVLSTYMSGTLPVRVNNHITWNHPLSVVPNNKHSSLKFHVFPHFTPTLRMMP